MTQDKHTPGPWVVAKDRNKVRRIFAGDSGPQVATASIFANWMPVERSAEAHAVADANARLIAAAPELLEALVMLRSEYNLFVGPDDEIADTVNDIVRAAITKATGQ